MSQNVSRVPPFIGNSAPRSSAGLALGLLGLVLTASVVLFAFNPAQHGFYPICLFHKLTGLLCPGCGSLRALHQLLHGNIMEALRLNALLVLALPGVAWVGWRAIYELMGGSTKPLVIRPIWVWGALAVTIAFGILRNLSFPAVGL